MKLTLASMGAYALGPGLAPAAQAADAPFVWAGVGGRWAEMVVEAFIKGTTFEGKVSQSAQVETIATSKILAACGNAPFAVSNNGPAEAALMAQGKCLLPYDKSNIALLDDLVPAARSDDYFGAFCILGFGLLWNTKEAKEPASFEDMWKPEYKGRIAIPAYGWYGQYWLHAMNKVLGGNENDVSPAIKMISKLVREHDAVLMENNDHAVRLIQSGQVIMAPYWNGSTARLKADGTPVEFKYVPGTLAFGSGFVIPASSSNPDQAQAFIANTLDPVRQQQFSIISRYPPASTKAVLPPEHQSVALPPEAAKNFAQLDWGLVNGTRDKNLELWNRQVL
ncbi:MAG TPA: extracellular solute-binding protein [Bordetella sp.]